MNGAHSNMSDGTKQAWVHSKHSKTATDYRNGYNFKNKSKISPTNLKKDEIPETSPEKETPKKEMKTCSKILLYSCLILLPVALMLTLVGMATPFWFDTGNASLGLFQICKGGLNGCEDVNTFLFTDSALNTWFSIIGLQLSATFMLLVGILFLMCVYPSCEVGTYKSIAFGITISVIVLYVAAAVITGTILMLSYYSGQEGYKLDWSFYLTASGGGLTALGFCLFLTHVLMFC